MQLYEAFSTLAHHKGTTDDMNQLESGADPGLSLLNYVSRSLSIDEEWSDRGDRVLNWWAQDLKQTIRALTPVDDDGMRVSRVSATCDLLSGVSSPTRNPEALALMQRSATMNGVIHDPTYDSRLQLACSVFVHRENFGWLADVFASAVALQVVSAQRTAPVLAEALGARVTSSNHPSSGPRESPDDMLNVVDAVFAPAGRGRSAWSEEHVKEAGGLVSASLGLQTEYRDGALLVDIPFDTGNALLRVQTEVSNPTLGNGVLLILTVPKQLNDGELGDVPLAVNDWELSSEARCHFLGSWCTPPEDQVDRGILTHVSFLPNALGKIGQFGLANLTMSMCMRAAWLGNEMTKRRS